MLGLHREALLFVIQSHKIESAALFVIVYALIIALSLTGAAIAFIAVVFLFLELLALLPMRKLKAWLCS